MIVGDSSALVALSVMDRKVYVPQAVYDEITIFAKPQGIKLTHFLERKAVDTYLDISQVGLGCGELEAISLYKHLDADFLLIDDKRAKNFAKLNDVQVIGSLGVLVLAKKLGKVKTIKRDIEKLLKSDIFISQILVDKILTMTGE